jgi:hypothetical protein
MPIDRKDPPLIENLFLLARERNVHIHIGVAGRDVGDPLPKITCQVTPANQSDKRVEHFTFIVQPKDPRASAALWATILEYVDRISPKSKIIRLVQ